MKILFAVDLTEPVSVIRTAERYAERLNGELLVLHVTSALPPFPLAPVDPMTGLVGYAPYMTYDPALQASLNEAEEHAFHLFLKERFASPVHAAVRHGDPAQVIVADATELGADLIILGKRHQTAVQRFLLGSVASEVIKHTPCATLLIPVPEAG
jgi:nucleotide-binding universal stress UspA family protein